MFECRKCSVSHCSYKCKVALITVCNHNHLQQVKDSFKCCDFCNAEHTTANLCTASSQMHQSDNDQIKCFSDVGAGSAMIQKTQ